MRKLVLGIAALAGLAAVAAAQAPARTPADLIRARQAGYKQMAPAMKAVFDQSRASEPSFDIIRANTATIARIAPLVGGWFPHGTGPEVGVPTRAKPEIWANPQLFRQRAAELVVAARALDGAAQSGDLAAVRAAFPVLRQACANCHDTFRGPEL
ncbi:MAG: c-type cytochrome [Alphaproteobacteria bacterium]